MGFYAVLVIPYHYNKNTLFESIGFSNKLLITLDFPVQYT